MNETYRLTLEPFGQTRAPAVVRVRQLLKAARRLGLRCVFIDGGERVKADGEPAASAGVDSGAPDAANIGVCGARRIEAAPRGVRGVESADTPPDEPSGAKSTPLDCAGCVPSIEADP